MDGRTDGRTNRRLYGRKRVPPKLHLLLISTRYEGVRQVVTATHRVSRDGCDKRTDEEGRGTRYDTIYLRTYMLVSQSNTKKNQITSGSGRPGSLTAVQPNIAQTLQQNYLHTLTHNTTIHLCNTCVRMSSVDLAIDCRRRTETSHSHVLSRQTRWIDEHGRMVGRRGGWVGGGFE